MNAHLGARGLPVSGAKRMLVERLTKTLNNNVVALSPEKEQHYHRFQNQEITQT